MTIQDIATRFKVSRSTASRALNPAAAHLISPSVRAKIQAYASKMRFIPNRTAQELSRGSSHTIGVILSTVFNSVFFNDYLGKVLGGIYAVLQENPHYNCKLIVLPRESTLSERDELVLRSGIDGLLITSIGDFSSLDYERMARRLAQRWNKPVVGLNMTCKHGAGLSTVSFDNTQAAKEAVNYLIAKGHTRIGLIWADNGSLDLRERIQGYRHALRDHGIAAENERMAKADLLGPGGYQAAKWLLNSTHTRPTALFCLNDEMAIGAMRAIKEEGLRCPDDMAVLGFDGLQLGELVSPRLTTVRQPVHEIAQESTRLLLELLKNRKLKARSIKIPAELIIRESA